ncbi:Pectate lyase superfamily protein [compost metagenome]
MSTINLDIDGLFTRVSSLEGGATLPTNITGPDGTTFVGFGDRTLYNKLGEHISVKDAPFNAKGDGVTDDTAAIQAAFNYIAANTASGATTSGSMSTSYTGTGPILFFPKGTYKITAPIVCGGYLEVLGESAIIKQYTDIADIFLVAMYQLKIQGMQFVGGRNQIDISNANTNSSMVEISHCQFFLSRNFAINTHAIGVDGGGNAWAHLSCDLNIYKCRFIACHQTINNCCDHATFEQCWIQPDKMNMSPSTAVMINRGVYPSDWNNLTRMHLKDCFLIPAIGQEGVDRVDSVRWIDNYGSFTASHCRFGGEYGGMRILDHLGAPNLDFPWNSTEVIFESCALYCGPDSRLDSAVMGIQGQIPNRFVMRNCTGPLGRPIIANFSSTDIASYMAAFEAGTAGRKAYEYFKIDIQDVIHDINAYTPTRTMIPSGLYPYLVKGRNTRISKTGQSLANAFAANPVSFDTIDFDNVGCFKIANPTQLLMPNGASRMRISVSAKIEVDGAAKVIGITIVDSGGTVLAGDVCERGINSSPDKDQIQLSTDVYGPPTSWWNVIIKHNAAAPLNMIECKVTCTPVDLIV